MRSTPRIIKPCRVVVIDNSETDDFFVWEPGG